MGRKTSAVDITITDNTINALLARPVQDVINPGSLRCRFNQNEDQFITLETPIDIPSLPVHHPIDSYEPPEGYRSIIATLAEDLLVQRPDLIAQTTWAFNPISIHTPVFYRIDKLDGRSWLYLLRLDLTCRPLEATILEEGTNTKTHHYRTDRLYLECDYFPLAQPERYTEGSAHFLALDQSIPGTWKGESGEGYMVHGIWMDSDINKFFSKLILPAGKRNHPFYPVTCKQYCIAVNAIGQKDPGVLKRVEECIKPNLDRILQDLQYAPFSEKMPLFQELKASIPQDGREPWENLTITAYLNERDQKEYSIEF